MEGKQENEGQAAIVPGEKFPERGCGCLGEHVFRWEEVTMRTYPSGPAPVGKKMELLDERTGQMTRKHRRGKRGAIEDVIRNELTGLHLIDNPARIPYIRFCDARNPSP
jgi:hypothetical protein